MTRGDFGSELAHCPTSDKALHGMVAVVPFAAGLSHEADAIMSRFGDSWTHNLKQLISSVEGICPDWRPQREDLLNQADLCKKMRDNKHYNKTLDCLPTSVSTAVGCCEATWIGPIHKVIIWKLGGSNEGDSDV